MNKIRCIHLFFVLCVAQFGLAETQLPTSPTSEQLNRFWNSGGAEISRYELQQARYGEIHQGYAALVFVTEPFNPSMQVKADDPKATNPKPVPVLKLNRTWNFNTGLYPYSVMVSTFSPMDRTQYPNPLKLTVSVQDWCGQVFGQFNLQKNGYRSRSFSYFETEGDRDQTLPAALPEDGLLNLIRLDPASLPLGRFKMISGLVPSRFLHVPPSAQDVETSISPAKEWGSDVLAYEVRFSSPKRSVTIYFKKTFPYEIEGWKESYRSGFGAKAKDLVSKAKKTHSIRSLYWNKNTNADAGLRKQLGLP